eukprot:m.122803 g.122803  ORF g.122803 m.122803 type:complete len:66 (+) comp15552_c0_seq3:1764-1961(+)
MDQINEEVDPNKLDAAMRNRSDQDVVLFLIFREKEVVKYVDQVGTIRSSARRKGEASAYRLQSQR